MTNHVYIIAEAGVNHNGDVELAHQLLEAGAAAGADAVKFQTFRPARLVTRTAAKAAYQLETTDAAESQLAMLEKLALRDEDFVALAAHAQELGVEFLSTPFDEESLAFLVAHVKMPAIKIPSGEITNAPFLFRAARSGFDLLLSTGMSTLGEIEQALAVLAYGFLHESMPHGMEDCLCAYSSAEGQAALARHVKLLHCTTQYPAPFAQANLRAIGTMRRAFGLPVGYSDHTQGIAVPLAAVACGATIIEKHFTLDRAMEGPDHKASLEPGELRAMVEGIRAVEQALGTGVKIPAETECANRTIVRKSLVAARDIAAGDAFTQENITAKRPAGGVSPMAYWTMLGRKAARAYDADEKIER